MATPVSCRQTWPLVALLLLGTGISSGGAGEQPDYIYRRNAAEVRLRFSAVDQNDHGVATLQASDFVVVDKGFIVRNFESFTRSDWTKLEIAILIDSSESITPHFRQEMTATLDLVAQTARVPDEALSMISFRGLNPALLCAGDCRSSGAAERLTAPRAGSLTPLFDTIVFASDFLSQHADAQTARVLILLSDGEDTISRNSLREAVDAASRNEVQIYGIDMSSPSARSRGAAVLQCLASATGGRYFPQTGATRAVNLILEGFRASYTVSYRLPSHAPGFHTVQIFPTHDLNLQFRSRSGYFYPNYLR